MPSDLERAAERFKHAIIARDAAAIRQLVRDYHDVLRSVQDELRPLLEEITERLEAGEPVNIGTLQRGSRLARIERDIIERLNEIVDEAHRRAVENQRYAARVASDAAIAMMEEAMGPLPGNIRVLFAELNPRAVESFVGFASDGSPLADLFRALPRDAARAVRGELIRGIALGDNPRVIARRIQGAFGRNLTRAMTISRTEVMRAYTRAAIEKYRANSSLIRGWVWISALDVRTCAVCIAMHGTEHPLDEPMASHPSCRCSAAPVARPISELTGRPLPDDRPRVEPGAEWFARQPAEFQRRVLGPAAYRAYTDGAIGLQDMVRRVNDQRWGPTLRRASLRDALGAAAAKYASAAGG